MAENTPTPDLPTEAQEDTKRATDDGIDAPSSGLSEHCVTDRATPATKPTGELTKFNDVEVYVSKPSEYPHSPSRLLLLLTSGTGLHSVNNQLQADKFAQDGFVVIMPDLFDGDAAPNSKTIPDISTTSLIEQIKLKAAETAKSFLIDMWLARHTAEKVLPILSKVLKSAQDEFADAVAYGPGIYAVGYCFGARYVILLAGKARTRGQEDNAVCPSIKAGAVAHATLVTPEDFEDVETPLSFACVENDQLFDESILEKGRLRLESDKIDHEIKTYTGVPHGFAVAGEYEDENIRKAQQEAYAQMLSWIKTH